MRQDAKGVHGRHEGKGVEEEGGVFTVGDPHAPVAVVHTIAEEGGAVRGRHQRVRRERRKKKGDAKGENTTE